MNNKRKMKKKKKERKTASAPWLKTGAIWKVKTGRIPVPGQPRQKTWKTLFQPMVDPGSMCLSTQLCWKHN
jgi:hypothetical protein